MTWRDFERRYYAQGRDKGDGYSPGDFDGLSDAELEAARRMMLDRALNGDSVDLSGLRYIGNRDTIAALDQYADAASRSGWRDDIIRLDVLYALTGRTEYLQRLGRYLDGDNKDAQQRAAYSLSWIVAPAEFDPSIAARICDGQHDAALLPLLKAWIGLRQRGVCDQACFNRNLPFIREVRNAEPARRAGLLARWREGGTA